LKLELRRGRLVAALPGPLRLTGHSKDAVARYLKKAGLHAKAETPRLRQGDRGRFPNPILTPPPDLVYALLHKHRRNGEVIRVDVRQVLGTREALDRALEASPVSSHVNPVFVERYNGTDRHRNSQRRPMKAICGWTSRYFEMASSASFAIRRTCSSSS